MDIPIAPLLTNTEGQYPILENTNLALLLPPHEGYSTLPWLAILFTAVIILAYIYRNALREGWAFFKKPDKVLRIQEVIQKVHDSHLLENKKYQEYAIALVDIVREHLSLLNKTYEEAVTEIDKMTFSNDVKLKIKGLLARVERVKFAREYPTLEECEIILARVREITITNE